MQNTKLIASVITSTVLLSSLTAFGEKTAQAQPRPIPLLRAKCVNSGLGNFREENTDVAIGKAVYNSQFFLGAGNRSASITCKIQPDNSPQPVFQTLNLGFGMLDNEAKSPGVEVKIFLDGKQAESTTVSPARQATLSLNVSNVSNVAIEAVCSSSTQYCGRVYFFGTSLERPNPAPKKN
jgi:hypothetical protein